MGRYFLFSLFVLAIASAGCGGGLSSPIVERDRMLYVASGSTNQIQAYDLDYEPPEGGSVEDPVYRYNTTGKLKKLAITKDQHWLYAVTDAGIVEQFEVRRSGRLLALSPSTINLGDTTGAIATAPNSAFCYIASSAGFIRQFAIASTGALSPLPVPMVVSSAEISEIIVSPDGSHLYAADRASSQVWQFAIGTDGQLTPLSPTFLSVSGGPNALAFNSSGSNLFSACADSAEVVRLSVDGGGKLSESQRVAGPTNASSMIVSRDYPFLYVSSNQGAGQVWRFTIFSGLSSLGEPQATFRQNQVSLFNIGDKIGICHPDDGDLSILRVVADGSLASVEKRDVVSRPVSAVYRENP